MDNTDNLEEEIFEWVRTHQPHGPILEEIMSKKPKKRKKRKDIGEFLQETEDLFQDLF